MHTLIQCYAIFVSVLYVVVIVVVVVVVVFFLVRVCAFFFLSFYRHFLRIFVLMLNGLFSQFRIEFICHMDQSECVERETFTSLRDVHSKREVKKKIELCECVA